MAITNQSSFPATIVVILGPAWDGKLGLSENDMVTLTKVSSTPGQIIYSEDGTSTPDESTNRIRIRMRAQFSTASAAPGISAAAEFATPATTATRFTYISQLTGTTADPMIYTQLSGPPYTYTFRRAWATNQTYNNASTITTANDGWPKVFKSMVEGADPGTFQYTASGGLTIDGTADITANDFAFIFSGDGEVSIGGTAIPSSSSNPYESTGGLVISSSAMIVASFKYSGTGGLAISGDGVGNTIQQGHNFISGGLRLGVVV